MSRTRVFGRPIKPVALGFAFSLTALAVLNLFNADEFGPSVVGDVLGICCLIAAITLTAAWWTRIQRMYEYGLLLAMAMWVQRSLFAAFTLGWGNRAVWLGLGWAVIAGTSFYMERMDPSGSRRWRAR